VARSRNHPYSTFTENKLHNDHKLDATHSPE
jgi:hypothetical protein